ncbi:quinone oxidoreductase family protein [Granulosicoccus antarcticus]|uniref:NADPH:quinone reductase n=1 Tax=Granulosicoccus antarcticus IMCC3135 TaxID=1192854 RepID=A0A2Z2P0A9_9GAMM|nr:quinone oxidoreductase [Granulosicoccus antarcticus]ASJ76195.1 2-haloacrylate reductase [Granulosicoccus antarcticus IMCC3135]
MTEAIIIRDYGGSDVLKLEPIELGAPEPGSLRVRHTAIGVNYHDVYVRSGLYKTLGLPGIPGCEATGVIESVGADVSGFQMGDRIAYVTGSYGAYASHRMLPASLAMPLPDGVTDEVVASNLLRAMTVEMLTDQVCQIEAGMTVLVHAAAGGVGKMLCQVLASLGATVIGTVGSSEKAQIAQENGCPHTILYRTVAFQDAVSDITSGAGVDVVYDSVGADTFAGSLEVLKMCGHLVNFGQSSGPVAPLAIATLAAKSLTVSRPILFHYLRDPVQYQAMAARVFDKFQSGVLNAGIQTPIPLKDAAKAHDTLESMTGGGSLILIP